MKLIKSFLNGTNNMVLLTDGEMESNKNSMNFGQFLDKLYLNMQQSKCKLDTVIKYETDIVQQFV